MAVFIQSHILMAWFVCSLILLPLFSIFLVFGMDQGDKLSDDKTLEKKAENVSKPEPIPSNKVLVEVTDAIEEEEEEEDGFVYTPSVAPATPHAFTSAQSVQFMDIVTTMSIAFQASKYAQLDHTPRVTEESSATAISADDSKDLNDSEKELSHIKVFDFEDRFSKEKSAELADRDVEEPSVMQQNVEVNISQHDEKVIEEVNRGNITGRKLQNDSSDVTIRKLLSVGLQNDELNEDKEVSGVEPVSESENKAHVNETDSVYVNETDTERGKSNETVMLNDLNINDPKNEKSNNKEESSENRTVVLESVNAEVENDENNGNAQVLVHSGTSESVLAEKIQAKVEEIKSVTVQQTSEADKKDTEEKGDSKMLSFTEWKKQHDKEKVKEEDVIIEDSKLGTLKNKTMVKKDKKIKKNYASIDCGGKVVAANDEASNILSVLKEDKDDYMLNPCNVKAWFIVELCERIQVETIDFANFEMFSSTPEIFNVYVASRYPSREWEKVGTFHAKPEKQIQTYTFEDKFYAKYLKVEIKKYFGKEHYCPLSLLRVFGITEVEQFEDDDDNEQAVEDFNPTENNSMNEDQNSGETINKGGNIFETAKNVVVDLVNGMAKKFAGKSNSETNDSSSQLVDIKSSKLVTLITSDDHILKEEDMTAYIENSTILDNLTLTSSWERWYYYRYPKWVCPISDFRTLAKENILHSKQPVSILSNSSSDYIGKTLASQTTNANFNQSISPKSRIPTIKQTSSVPSVSSFSTIKNIISTSEVSQSVQETSDLPLVRKTLATSTISPSLKTQGESNTATVSQSDNAINKTTYSKSSDIGNSNSTRITTDSTSSNTSAGQVKSSASKQIYDEDLVDVLEFKINETLKGGVIAERIAPYDDASNSSIDSNLEKNKTINNITIDEEQNVTAIAKNDSTDSSFDNQSENIHLDSSNNINRNSSTGLGAHQIASSSYHVESSGSLIKGGTESLKSISQISLSPIPPLQSESSTQVVQSIVMSEEIKLSEKSSTGTLQESSSIEKESQTVNPKLTSGISGSKESIIAKLNAKVKALQANLTMSMMYLDEMSERYRTAVEEVDERHKKKYLSLNTTLKIQQEMINQQADFIANLNKQIKELSFQLQNLTHSTEEQHQKIIETHATWVFLEIIIILIFLLLCQRNPYRHREIDQKRRYSEPVLMKHDENVNAKHPLLKKQLSEPAFNYNRDCSSLLQTTSKKRQRKKSNSFANGDHKTSEIPRTSNSKTAGLLFHAGRGLISGITGAFSRNRDQNGRLSQQTDALVDDVSNRIIFDRKSLRKAISAELPPINEDEKMIDQYKSSSCFELDYNGVCKKFKTDKRACDRYE